MGYGYSRIITGRAGHVARLDVESISILVRVLTSQGVGGDVGRMKGSTWPATATHDGPK